MTQTKDILKLAEILGQVWYGNPAEVVEGHIAAYCGFTAEQVEKFYRAAHAAGQAEMRERAAKECDSYKVGLSSELAKRIRALPIGENE